MEETIIDNHNSKVNAGDLVYILGDFAFKIRGVETAIKIWRRLKGRKVLIPGNHDKQWIKKLQKLQVEQGDPGIVIDNALKILKHNKIHFSLCHYPLESWYRSMRDDSFHFHGHCHGTSRSVHRRLDVGVDCHNFYPINIEEAMEKALAIQ